MSDTSDPSRESKPSIDPPGEPLAGTEIEAAPWYKDGLRFGCTGCGACCTIEGHVWVDRREIRRLAKHLDLELDAFARKYLRRLGRRYGLTEIPFPGNPVKKACVFWDGACSVYDARPKQCRTFPFWRENLESSEAWQEAARLSPGIDSGRLYQLGEIEKLAGGAGEAAEPSD